MKIYTKNNTVIMKHYESSKSGSHCWTEMELIPLDGEFYGNEKESSRYRNLDVKNFLEKNIYETVELNETETQGYFYWLEITCSYEIMEGFSYSNSTHWVLTKSESKMSNDDEIQEVIHFANEEIKKHEELRLIDTVINNNEKLSSALRNLKLNEKYSLSIKFKDSEFSDYLYKNLYIDLIIPKKETDNIKNILTFLSKLDFVTSTGENVKRNSKMLFNVYLA